MAFSGFLINFDKPTFKATDKIEVKTLLGNISIDLGKNAKKFFKNLQNN